MHYLAIYNGNCSVKYKGRSNVSSFRLMVVDILQYIDIIGM